MFSNNQTSANIHESKLNKIAISQFISAFYDDVSFNDNQTECIGFNEGNSNLELSICNSYFIGGSIRSNANRFVEESIKMKVLSLFSSGYVMNSTIGNQADHCIIPPDGETYIGNIVLDNTLCKPMIHQPTTVEMENKIYFSEALLPNFEIL